MGPPTQTTEEDITMFRFLQRSGRDSQARGRGTGPLTRVRRRNHPLNCEALEGRQLLSGYYIINASSGKVLDNSLSTSSGTVIAQWQLYGGTNQQWNLIQAQNGYWRIQNSASQLSLDNSLSTSNGTVIDQWQPRRLVQPAMDFPAATGRQLFDHQLV